MLYRHSFAWMVIGVLVNGLATVALSEENPKALIAKLPEIDYSKQCDKRGECDHTIEEEVFTTLARLSDRHLKRGMSKGDVDKIFRKPPDRKRRLLERRSLWKPGDYLAVCDFFEWDYCFLRNICE
ncbi:MAG TPA: hypothetical protein VE616_15800 [Candidatus Udaeobacter sp.]|nr:hypothetical protein [Candidatus Udaeobacter sp.]